MRQHAKLIRHHRRASPPQIVQAPFRYLQARVESGLGNAIKELRGGLVGEVSDVPTQFPISG
jgi:hypothetical protein